MIASILLDERVLSDRRETFLRSASFDSILFPANGKKNFHFWMNGGKGKHRIL